MMKNIYLLGATGSIGRQVLDVISQYPDKYCLKSIAFGKNIKVATEIIEQFNVQYVCAETKEDALKLKEKFPHIEVGYGEKGLIKAATYSSDPGVLINAVVGDVGLTPTIEAIKVHRDILLANKETLVVAGEIIKKMVAQYNVQLIPIDSEHSAIFQALKSGNHNEISKIIITASGGAFRDYTREQLVDVTIDDALKHPSWTMGAKITVDCATMANKGLEVIEAHYLFDLDYNQIETIIHKESIVHSLVEFVDKSVIAQMATSDMHIPIQYALSYPLRIESFITKSLDLENMNLTFSKMDFKRYPLLELAYNVGRAGGIMPAVYNASNEAANYLFRCGKIKFLDIERIVFETVKQTNNINDPSLDEILNVSKQIKSQILGKYEVKN